VSRLEDPPLLATVLSSTPGEKQRIKQASREKLFGSRSAPAAPLLAERYQVGASIGRGGLGRVYRARDVKLRREVAVKFIRADLDHAELFSEALVLARIAHPNIVGVFDVGRAADEVFIVMELVEGQTLEDWIAVHRSWRECLPPFVAAGRALQAAHDAMIVHGDFKPANAMIDRAGHVRVLDFGLARDSFDVPVRDDDGAWSESETRTGGTAGYLAPEQHRGIIECRSDQYAFCVSLFRALWHTFPVDPSNKPRELRELIERPLARSQTGDVPRWLRAVVLRGLHPDPERRYPSMAALLKELTPPRRRWPGFVLGAAALGSVTALTVDRASICRFDDGGPEQVWTAGRREVLERAAPPGTDLAAIAHTLGRYSEEWSTLRQASCEAHRGGTIGTTVYDLRLACLRRSMDQVDFLLQQPERADFDRWPLLVGAVDELATVVDCTDDAALLDARPTEAADPVIFDAITNGLAVASVYMTLGEQAAHLQRLLELEETLADPVAEPGGTLWLQMHIGGALNAAERYEEAEARLRPALLTAQRWHRWPDAEGTIMIALAEALTQMSGRVGEALLLAEQALATLESSSMGRGHLRSGLRALALAQHTAGRELDALASLDRIALAPESPSYREVAASERRIEDAGIHNLRGLVLEALGRRDDAEAAYRVGLIATAALGYPSLVEAQLRNNLALVLQANGREQDAIAELRLAAGIKSKLGQPRAAALSLMNVGNVQLRAKQATEAIATYDEALALWVEAGEHADGSLLRLNRAFALHEAGRRGEAQHDYAMVIDGAAADPSLLFPALLGRGGMLLDAGDTEPARADFERALRIEPDDAHPYDRCELRFGLARALPPSESERSTELARAAAELAIAADDRELGARVDEWLRERASSSPAR
jgi:eukaryotic-like serine/threonine-protein kinase